MTLNRILLMLLGLALAQATPASTDLPGTDWDCLRGFLETGADHLTLGEMRTRCAEAAEPLGRPETAASRRLEFEREVAARPFSMLAHKPNYMLLGAWNSKGWDPSAYQQATSDPNYVNKDVEAQFQISLKVPLAIDLFNGRMDLWAAYTNRSFWQVYNGTYSEPFRETNHEPELWAQFRNDWEVFGLTNVVNSVGWVHQSNGRADPLSRSWNRIFARFIFEKENFAFAINPWIWVSKDKETSDNPDIDDYMGWGELRAAWRKNGHVVSAMARNQLESGFDRGALEIGWSFPVFNYPYLKGYVQYFNGYGESLIDYNRKVNRIGVGISVTDWLD